MNLFDFAEYQKAEKYEMRTYQREAVDAVLSDLKSGTKKAGIILPVACHAKGTKILMFNGSWKNVEEICVGDVVMGDDSTPRIVKNTHNGVDMMYKVIPNKGDSFVVNGNHILSLELTPIKKGDATSVKNISVVDYFKKSNDFKRNHKLYKRGVTSYQESEVSIPAYILGIWLGDGASKVASLTTMDDEILAEWSKYVTEVCPNLSISISKKKDNNKSRDYNAVISDRSGKCENYLIRELKKIGVYNNKHIPRSYMVSSTEQRIELLSGLIDTDGYLSGKFCYDIIQKNERLAFDIKELAQSLGFHASVVKCSKSCQNGYVGEYFRVTIGTYGKRLNCRLDRKNVKSKPTKYTGFRTGFTIEAVGVGEFFGFEVDGNRLYIMEDFWVSHNSGKTEIFINLSNEYLNLPDNGDKIVLILSHLDILTKQSSERYKKRFPFCSIGILQGNQRPDPRDNVVVGTMQSVKCEIKLNRWLEDNCKKVGMIIVDEAHFILTDSYQKIFQMLPEAAIIGFTATPFRDSKLMTNYFDKISYSKPLHEMIEAGFLVPIDLKQIILKDDSLEGRIAQVVDLYERCEKGKKAIVFMRTIEDCNTCRNAFTTKGINTKVVTSEITGKTRDAILDEYENTNVDVLITVNVLTAGFDSPKTSAIFMPFATHSPTTYMQRIGRGLRLCPDIGKTKCNVYAFGTEPVIASGRADFINQLIHGKRPDKTKLRDVFEELVYMEVVEKDCASEKYKWTKHVCDIAEKVAKLKMFKVEELIKRKEFPKRFLMNLDKLANSLPVSAKSIPHGDCEMTPAQKIKLNIEGFPDWMVREFTRNEASALIETAKKFKGEYDFNDPHIIREGKFKGKHISELPYVYRKYVCLNMPESSVAQQIRAFNGTFNANEPNRGDDDTND